MSSGFDDAALRACPLVATLELHQELGSTNDRAKQLAATEPPLPALVLTHRQTAGRGRGSNQWWSADGALTFSLLIRPENHGVRADRVGLLSLTTAVAVANAARAVADVECGLKWPNDVLIEGKKLAGVLLESPRAGSLVIGVGLNVATCFDGAPQEIRARATSLAEQTNAPVTRQAALESFLAALQQRLTQLATEGSGPIEAAREACVLTGKRVTIRQGDREVSGLCTGLDHDGALLIQADADPIRVVAGTVKSFH